jgi:zinc transport system substrate-binding protein
MILMKRWVLVLTLALLPATTGCSALSSASSPGLQVAASIYPIAWISQQVAGQPVELLTTPGVEPHDFELTIAETAQIADADLVVYERGLQPAVDEAVDDNAPGDTLDAARVVGLDGEDPHFWLDPVRMEGLTRAVADHLSRVVPSRAAEFRRNAAAVERSLGRLDTAYRNGLAHCVRHTIVVSHEAYGYLGRRYGLSVDSISGLSPEDPPTPAHLAQLQDLIRSDGITTVFSEPLGNFKVPDAVYGDLGVKVVTLDPIEGQTDPAQDYLDVMRSNLVKIQEANGCTP